MNPNELGEFSTALLESARVIGKTIGAEDAKPLFNYLSSHPLKIVIQAMDRALRKRDPDDIFQRSQLLNGLEIEESIKEIMSEALPKGAEGKVNRCKTCNGNGWLTFFNSERVMKAYPCRCLYESAQEALRTKKRPGSFDAILDFTRKHIVKAYEYHQRKWGNQGG